MESLCIQVKNGRTYSYIQNKEDSIWGVTLTAVPEIEKAFTLKGE